MASPIVRFDTKHTKSYATLHRAELAAVDALDEHQIEAASVRIFVVATPEGRFVPAFYFRRHAVTQHAVGLAFRGFYVFN